MDPLQTPIGTEAPELRLAPRIHRDRAPLAHSQLQHWNAYRLYERRAIRHVASATRLRGQLSIDALRKSLAEIVRRHDALRTRIVIVDQIPAQEISLSDHCELEKDDLTASSESTLETEVQRRIEQFILAPIDVSTGPLFGLKLLKLRSDEHVLIVAAEHIVSDVASLNILLGELLSAYAQAVKGHAFSLPAVSIQLADYAVRQRSAQPSWIEQHGAYWQERLARCQRLRFPESKDLPTPARTGWGAVSVRIDRDLKLELLEWCRLRRTPLVRAVFTAYVALVLRWCNASAGVFQCATHGRASPELARAIGYFASVVYPHIELLEGDRFVDLLNRVTAEYRKALEHADSFYLETQSPRPEFTRNAVFNWAPQESEINLSDLDDSEYKIACSPVAFPNPILRNLEKDNEPVMGLRETEDGIVGGVLFPLNRFSTDTMERFGRNFLVFIRQLIRQPEERVSGVFREEPR